MEEYALNLYPIFKFIIILFAIVGGYNSINNFMNLLARYGKDRHDFKKDSEVIKSLSNRDVKIITVENSKDIHNMKKELEEDIKIRLENLENKILGE